MIEMSTKFPENIFHCTQSDFLQLSLDNFRFQYACNSVYRDFALRADRRPEQVASLTDIPFLPISFFKTHALQSTGFKAEAVFESSGTTQAVPSRHYVKDLLLYKESFIRGFEKFYGPLSEWCIIGLLPSYLERKGSSLVLMVEELVRLSGKKESGLYLNEFDELALLLQGLEARGQATCLIGVTFALLDFAAAHPMQLNHTILMETGGMKGRGKELTRPELHQLLRNQLGPGAIHSEYGMTELLSQAYSGGEGIFHPVPWMKVLVRDEDDPMAIRTEGSGILNIIDLANRYSCSFISTDDVGKVNPDGSFEVFGRMDNSDIRGCSLLVL